ncbi:hypothetical protein HUG15_19905 [Salicibibacter cibarius]|uniref:Uncharacterized protein n=1 Tax=Salicibibacter cibarius TaxID=2743000 RepID=A0A7T6Z608_9BACI|nr:hypothetical protein [Salicibibacter cibarius]QQK77625.1 hypothetical protein HUG15_19905 [Salicibibacter cibarius]
MSDKAWNRLFWAMIIGGSGAGLLFAWYGDRNTEQVSHFLNENTWVPLLFVGVLAIMLYVGILALVRTMTGRPISIKTVFMSIGILALILIFYGVTRGYG